MNSLMQWLVAWLLMLGLSLFWLCYLIRSVLQDEVVQEQRRRRYRNRELRRRAVEDEENAKFIKTQQRKRAAARAANRPRPANAPAQPEESPA